MRVYFLKEKNQVAQRFADHVTLCERQTELKVRRVRSDNGGEFRGAPFATECSKRGIQQEHSAPYSPQQNGTVERRNRTIVEMARALLNENELPKFLWAEAVATAVHILNRVPTEAIGKQTHYCIWFGRKPRVKHLRVYGSAAYALRVGEHLRKMAVRTKKGVLVGYDPEGHSYKIYDAKARRVFLARDVIFDEASERGTTEEICIDKDDTVQDHNKEGGKEIVLSPMRSEADTESCNREEETIDSPEAVQVQAEENRLQRCRKRPLRFQDYVLFAEAERVHMEPQDVQDARASNEWTHWENAMKEELEAMKAKEVWELMNLPEGRKSIGCKWVF